MPTPKHLALILVSLIFAPLITVLAQNETRTPLALLRQSPNGASFSIRVQTNSKLPTGSRLSAILSNKDKLESWQENVPDCGVEEPGKFCKRLDAAGRVELDFPLRAKPTLDDKFNVSFAISDGTGSGSFRALEVIADFKVSGPRLDANCEGGFILDVKSDNKSLAQGAEAEYYKERIMALDAWFKANKGAPLSMAKVQIEPLTKRKGPSDYTITSFSVTPGADGNQNAQAIDVDGALALQGVQICLQFKEQLPDEKYIAQVDFANSPPMELERSCAKILTPPKSMNLPSASSMQDGNKLGLRSFEDNFNLGLLYTSSVSDAKQKNKPIRQRQSRGSLDLRFAPLLLGRMSRPEVKKWQPFVTPFSIDAKISTGRIADDTLSLNRVLLASEVAFRYYQSTEKGKRNKYIVTLRGVNATDRDFKRAEIKGEVEFKPIFEALNHPLRLRPTSASSVLKAPDIQLKEIPNTAFFGYEFQPFIGLELGTVYKRDRSSLKGEELGTSVRRIHFGADTVFSLSRRLTLKLSDTFYFSGGVKKGRTRNWFSGTIDVPIGNLSRNSSQSIFFQFERGDQPPFVSPSVNALKFGYRVRSNFFGTGTSW